MMSYDLPDTRLPSVTVLTAIDHEQRLQRATIDGTWRIGSVIVLGAVLTTPAFTWLSAGAIIASIIIATWIVQREIQACTSRIAAIRRALMMHEEGNPNQNVQALVEFLNSPDMVPAVSRYESWGYWVWALVVVIVIVANTAW
jgi:hypothetical protein